MKGETILCIAPRLWDSLWRESQQIMSRLAKQNRVLYFEPGRDYDRPHLAEMGRNLPNFLALRARKVHDNLIVIPTPSTLPIARRHLPLSVLRKTMPLVQWANAGILARHVHWAMKAFGVKEPILWLNAVQLELIGRFGEKLACYHNFDEIGDFIHNSHVKELVRQRENEMVCRADVVFATSRPQWQRRKALNSNTYFIPNGVDFGMFNRALEPDLPLPADIASIPRPIIGFAGWLSYYIDVALLCRVAEAYPDCSLVLVGPDDLPDGDDRRRLRALANVFFLGKKERWELPNYLQAFDAALMPWMLEGHVLSAYPLKLHEYLAAGRAIVSVALPELEPFREVVRIARSHDDYLSHVRHALHDYSREAIEARVAVARENTWDHRIAEIYRVLEDHLAAKRHRRRAEVQVACANALGAK